MLYYLQGTLYAYGSILAKLILVILLFVSFINLIRALRNGAPKYLLMVTFLIILFIIYTPYNALIENGWMFPSLNPYNFTKNVFISLLPIFSYYWYAKRGLLTENLIKTWLWIFLPVAIASFYREQNARLAMALEEGSKRIEFTNNTGYLFVSLFPLLCFYKNRTLIQYLVMALLTFFIIISMKRGAIFTGAVCIPLIIINSLSNSRWTKRIFVVVLSIILVFIIHGYIQHMFETSDFFNQRFQKTIEGDSSNRDFIYNVLWNKFTTNTSVLEFFFGKGLNSTLLIVGNGAHNDWLEIAIDIGLLGLITYIIYWYVFIKTWKNMTFDNTIQMAMGLIVISEFMKTWFSFSINDMPIYELPVLGYCLSFHQLNTINSSIIASNN